MRKKREKDNNRHEREATAQLAVLETPSDLRNVEKCLKDRKSERLT